MTDFFLFFLLGKAMGNTASKMAYSPAWPDDLTNPMDVLLIDAPTCGLDCYSNKNCMSFAYDSAKGQCKKYKGNFFGNFQNISRRHPRTDIPIYDSPMYFFNLSHALDRGYMMDRDAGLCYKVASEHVSHDEAEAACSQDKARLLAVQTMSQLNAVQAYVNSTGSKFALHVAGSGEDMTYYNTQPIPDILLSANGYNVTGNCTHLTMFGLSNGECFDKLPFICAY
ncbi:uncharacterized protein LOC132543408 [Ylistrum balloti]|uniref:uncharacterized protein LOC132543408 n=1 Tax=Ylistrum balloti TaxID=509963 RepID=UPI002905D351|nr:uncharacterized protein LOC132543408 [Ylistrum balloti]